jgi:hypothetical protein
VQGRKLGRMKTVAALSWVVWMASASCSAQTLVIRLYDYVGFTARDAVHLSHTVDRAFSHSGIHIRWRHCLGPLALPFGTACQGEISFNEIAVNLEPHRARNSNDPRLCMGQASVNAVGGYSADIFVPAVREQATRFGLPLGLLSGYVLAHEVGHCLLGPGHSYAGLMRSQWRLKDAQEISQLSLHLTHQEREKALARVAWLNAVGPSLGQSYSPAEREHHRHGSLADATTPLSSRNAVTSKSIRRTQ